jgi:hypothetical protein
LGRVGVTADWGEQLVSDLFKRARELFGRAEPEPKPAPVRKAVSAWHAVSIVTGQRACDAARELSGHRFLSRDAPPLPLKKCDSPACTCRYEHHEDRRKGARRASEIGVTIDGYLSKERRSKMKRGRRKKDA